MKVEARPRGVQRWGGYVVLVVVFSIACGLLSWWQWARREEALARIDLVERNYDQPAAPLSSLLDGASDWDPAATWRPVELRGRYLADEALLVRNRPYDGAPGFEQLVPLRLDDGSVFIVDRGWIPVGNAQDTPDSIPDPPAGDVTVVARLKASEPQLPGRTAPEGQIPSIDLPTIAGELGGTVYSGAYGLLASEDPATPAGAPAVKPEADEGPHLSYAIQWIAFALLAIGGLVWAIRRERRIAALPEGEQAAARAPKRRRDTDADVEDALLDRNGR